MAKITLSRTGLEFDLAVNGWSKTDESLSLIVITNDASLGAVEEAFTNNETITLTDESITVIAENYTDVSFIGKQKKYPIGGIDETGKDILHDVWLITCEVA